jgi:hypothetical protein
MTGEAKIGGDLAGDGGSQRTQAPHSTIQSGPCRPSPSLSASSFLIFLVRQGRIKEIQRDSYTLESWSGNGWKYESDRVEYIKRCGQLQIVWSIPFISDSSASNEVILSSNWDSKDAAMSKAHFLKTKSVLEIILLDASFSMLLFSKSKNSRAAGASVKKPFKIDKDTVLFSTVNFELNEIPKIIAFALQKFHTKCCTDVFMGWNCFTTFLKPTRTH